MSQLQKEIIKRMGVKPEIDPAFEIRQSIDLMKNYLVQHPFLKSFVLGISGGQDSTLLGKLAQMAIQEMRQETGDPEYLFIAVRLPYGNQFDESDAQEVLEWIVPDRILTVNIQEAVDETVSALATQGLVISDFNKGNIKARQRMIVQYAIAGEMSGVVLGSDHAAENLTGFFTKFGDGASDLNPLFRLNKRQGRDMLKALDAPPSFYEKVPTADLEDESPGQSDEESLGVSYDTIDRYLEGEDIPEEDRKTIESLYLKSEHKRQLPITIFDDFWK